MKSKIALVLAAMFAIVSLSACSSDLDETTSCPNDVGVYHPDCPSTSSTTAKVLSTIAPTTTQQTTTTQPTTTTSQTPTTTSRTVTVYATTLPPTPTPNTVTVYAPPPVPTQPAWTVGAETVCTAQEVQLGSQTMFGITVTFTSTESRATIAFSGQPNFPIGKVLVTYGDINVDRGFHGNQVVDGGGNPLLGSQIAAGTSNGGGFVTIASAGKLKYAAFCF